MDLQVAERLKKIIKLRLKATEEKFGEVRLPRLVRLWRKFNLSPNETDILMFVMARQSGRGDIVEYEINPITLAEFLEITLQEIVEFLNQDHLHIQQGLFPDIEHSSSAIFTEQFYIDPHFHKILLGADVKQNDFLKLEQTCLADVIAAEPEHQHLRDQVTQDNTKETDIEEGSKDEESV